MQACSPAGQVTTEEVRECRNCHQEGKSGVADGEGRKCVGFFGWIPRCDDE